MDNKYGKEFLDSTIKLDAIVGTSGVLTNKAQDIIKDESREAIVTLCNEIKTIIDSKSNTKEVLTLAKYVNDNLLKYIGYNRVKEICSDNNSDEEEYDLTQLIDELDDLVGLQAVKQQVKDLIAFQMVNQRRIAKGLHATKRTLHLAFIGNPGTGKTTVARIVGRIYKEIGLLSKGHFIEVSRTDLIAGYQGQTALKVKNVIDKAKGGVLFIDEAYSITENDHSDSYGKECLTELTKALEDYRSDLVVIVAGYTEPMIKFFQSNPGLKSRFNTFIRFDDYSDIQLLEMMEKMCTENDYYLEQEVKNKLLSYFKRMIEEKDDNFANGRLARNIYEKLVMNHARRVVSIEKPTREELSTIIADDFEEEKSDMQRG